MLVPYAATADQAGPVTEVVAACRKRGLWPFANFNRVHVLPPCNTTRGEALEGLEILDDALTIADQHVLDE
jgi:taurine--2-oxoglutarate transaminase